VDLVTRQSVNKENEHRYLKAIREDMEYFGRTLRRAKLQYRINGKNAEEVTDGRGA
jgi:hypothetical protein